jgi:hypothetical protein
LISILIMKISKQFQKLVYLEILTSNNQRFRGVHGFKNTSVRSNVGSESNHTFADKLKSFDKANRNTVNGFGKAS